MTLKIPKKKKQYKNSKTVNHMNKRIKKVKLTVSIPTKNDNIFRRQAFNAKKELSDLFIEYQNVYLRELEKEKAQKEQKNQENQEKETKKES